MAVPVLRPPLAEMSEQDAPVCDRDSRLNADTVTLIRRVHRQAHRRRSELIGLRGPRALISDYLWAASMEMTRYGIPGRAVLHWLRARVENVW